MGKVSQQLLAIKFRSALQVRVPHIHFRGLIALLYKQTHLAARLTWMPNYPSHAALLAYVIYISLSQTKSGSDRLRQLYTDVQRRGPKAYARLVDALVQSGNVTAARCENNKLLD